MAKAYLCLPKSPLPDEENMGRHPKIKLLSQVGKTYTYICVVCSREFIIEKEPPV